MRDIIPIAFSPPTDRPLAPAGGRNDTIPASEPLLLRSRDAAKLLAIGERTLWRMTADGKIPAVKMSRTVRYDMRDLLAYIEQCKRSG